MAKGKGPVTLLHIPGVCLQNCHRCLNLNPAELLAARLESSQMSRIVPAFVRPPHERQISLLRFFYQPSISSEGAGDKILARLAVLHLASGSVLAKHLRPMARRR